MLSLTCGPRHHKTGAQKEGSAVTVSCRLSRERAMHKVALLAGLCGQDSLDRIGCHVASNCTP